MKIKNLTPFLSMALIAILCSSLKCSKDKTNPPTTLPPITQEGKNTFGCKVNGGIWVPYYKCGGSGNPCGELFVDVYPAIIQQKIPIEINMSFTKKNQDNSSTGFQINTKQNFKLFTTGNKIDSLNIEFSTSSFKFYRNSNNNGSFQLTKLDTLNNIISGLFETTLYVSATDSVKITEGRFDLKFQVCKCSN